MDKQKLFIDFDSTICNSIKSFCEVYNTLYSDEPNFKPARWMYVEQWNFKDECPILEGNQQKINDIFEHDLFFQYLEFMDDLTERVIQRLCDKYFVIVNSIGTPLNIAKKAKWLKSKLPCVKDYILIANLGNYMNKTVINMGNAIQIDDVVSNLNSTNAKNKIIFGDYYSWNLNADYPRAFNWTDVDRILL